MEPPNLKFELKVQMFVKDEDVKPKRDADNNYQKLLPKIPIPVIKDTSNTEADTKSRGEFPIVTCKEKTEEGLCSTLKEEDILPAWLLTSLRQTVTDVQQREVIYLAITQSSNEINYVNVNEVDTSNTSNERNKALASKSHQQIHFKCDICNLCFSHKIFLIQHIREHTGEKPFKCEACSGGYNQRHELTTHQRVHTGEKPFKCIHCNRGFKSKYTLSLHQKVHLGEKPFNCNLCPSVFSRKSNLVLHQKVHTRAKKLKCNHCCASYKGKKSFIMHLSVHT